MDAMQESATRQREQDTIRQFSEESKLNENLLCFINPHKLTEGIFSD